MPVNPYSLFTRFGVEIEYMAVDRDTLAVSPVADKALARAAGLPDDQEPPQNVDRGAISWSNELVQHVLELKTRTPRESLKGLAAEFQSDVEAANTLLGEYGAQLMPTAMHPFMDPLEETRLWPWGDKEIYQAFDRIFGCRGHGWSNLQSTHINLPWATEEDFLRLHAAIRVLLPLLPALAASSPFVEGRVGPLLDMRLDFYRANCAAVPILTGQVVPEPIRLYSDYRDVVLNPIADALKPIDTAGILEAEWTNARGAIGRFDRGSIEIRVLDNQECPAADLAVVEFVVAILRHLIGGPLTDLELSHGLSTESLYSLLLATMEDGADAELPDRAFAEAFGCGAANSRNAGELLQELFSKIGGTIENHAPLENILNSGCLSARILRATGASPSRREISDVYRQLVDCLAQGRLFES